MSKINLTLAHNEDWKSFLSSDDKKRHWINQRILEDENQWLEETVQPQPKPYVKPKKEKLTLIQIIQFPKQIICQNLP